MSIEKIKPISKRNIQTIESSNYSTGHFNKPKQTISSKVETLNLEQTSTPNIDRVFEEDSGLNFDIVRFLMSLSEKQSLPSTDDNKKKYIQVIAMDTKADEHTDNNNMYTYLIKDKTVVDTDKWGNPVYASETSVGGMIEFATIDKDVMSESTNGSGDCSDAKDILKGEITSIYKIKINYSYLKKVKV